MTRVQFPVVPRRRVIRGMLLVVGLLFPFHLPFSLGKAADGEKLLGWWASPRESAGERELVVVRTLWHAGNSGLLPGDVVRTLNGQPATPSDLERFTTAARPGDTATLTILREGEQHSVRVPVRDSSPSYAAYRWYRIGLATFAWLVAMVIILRFRSRREALLLAGALLLIGPVTVPVAFVNENFAAGIANGLWHIAGGIYRFLLPLLLLLFFLGHTSKRRIFEARWLTVSLAGITVLLAAAISEGFTSPLAWTTPGFEMKTRAIAGLLAEIAAMFSIYWIARDFKKMPQPVHWLAFGSLLVLASGAVLSVAMVTLPGAVGLLDGLRQVKALALALLPMAATLYALVSASDDPNGSWDTRVRASAFVSAVLSLLYGCAVAGAAAITLSISGLSLNGAEPVLFGVIVVATLVFAPVLRWSREMVDRHVFSSWVMIEQKAHALVQELQGELEPHKLAERVRTSLPRILGVGDVSLILAEERVSEWYSGTDAVVEHSPAAALAARVAAAGSIPGRGCEPIRNSAGDLVAVLEYAILQENSVFAPPEQRAVTTIVQGIAVALRNTEAYFDLQKANRALSENERVTSLAVMAGGLAHEIKNPLASLKMGLYLLRRESSDQNRLLRIEGDVRRIDDLVSSLLRFTHSGNPELREHIEVAASVQSIVADLATLARDRDVQVEEIYPDSPVAVMASSSELRVMVSSILHNALDACSAGGRVVVEVAARNEAVEIAIIDNGRGIAPGFRRRVFDLNFSTKQGGSGLGLALARREAERLGGSISVDSTVGYGTTMRILLPAVSEALAARVE